MITLSVDKLFDINYINLELGKYKFDSLYKPDHVIDELNILESNNYIYLVVYISENPVYNTGIAVRDVLDRLDSYIEKGYQGSYVVEDTYWVFFIKKD